ncbi:uncharacterized protein LOC113367587 [Ctenocephalides felis]|uniref:uncharacterized protein LOC113367587 n=1 Tax=Ctenocephalides felis TaxID=7515 RepID=UPI000E6E131C|nr:uncharacterized protein LOC113367587 [Ctenocephalides felis]
MCSASPSASLCSAQAAVPLASAPGACAPGRSGPAAQFNTYVTLKLQNVKSTTVTVKGASPCWEQDFLFETDDVNTGLLIEVWSKGMIWDRAMGYHWLPLPSVPYSNEDGAGQWISLEAELVMRDGEVVGTKGATGHSLLVDCRFELPFDLENTEGADLPKELEMLNNIMDQEARAEQARRQFNIMVIVTGYSEDSDYTSDLNYPVGQHPNSSASQFRSAAHQMHTPQRSLETSRENSYERDDGPPTHQPSHGPYSQHLTPGNHYSHHRQRYSPHDDYGYGGSTGPPDNTYGQVRSYNNDPSDPEPLFYNSRPRSYRTDYSSQQEGQWYDGLTTGDYPGSQNYEDSLYKQMQISDTATYLSNQEPPSRKTRVSNSRRPSLERQETIYNEYNVSYMTNTSYDGMGYPTGVSEEHRQWDSGGGLTAPAVNGKWRALPEPPVADVFDNQWSSRVPRRRSGSVCGARLPKTPAELTQDDSFSATEYTDISNITYPSYPATVPTQRRKLPQARPSSRCSNIADYVMNTNDVTISHRGASLPATPPCGTPTRNRRCLPQPRTTTPGGRRLPQITPGTRRGRGRRQFQLKRNASAEQSEDVPDYYDRSGAMSAIPYNEDYNYAYTSSNDNLEDQMLDKPVAAVTPARRQGGAALPQVPQVPAYQPPPEETYYSAQEDYSRPRLGGRKTYFEQQNTDSLESRDDDLKADSFDTAFSSVSTAFYKNQEFQEYKEEYDKPSVVTTSAQQQYFRDQQDYQQQVTTTSSTLPHVSMNGNN